MIAGTPFFVVLLYEQGSYFGCVLAETEEAVKKAAAERSAKARLVLCTLPFAGRWSPQGVPDVTLPDDFKVQIGSLDWPVKEEA